MSEFTRSRHEVQSFIDKWLDANKQAERNQDWAPLADYYAEHATYSYTLGAFGKRVARGRDAIKRLVMQRDMEGFTGWTFPYDWIVVEGDKMMTRWYVDAPYKREDGTPYRSMGMSAIRLNNDLQIQEMEDSIDVAAVFALFSELKSAGYPVTIPTVPILD